MATVPDQGVMEDPLGMPGAGGGMDETVGEPGGGLEEPMGEPGGGMDEPLGEPGDSDDMPGGDMDTPDTMPSGDDAGMPGDPGTAPTDS